MILYAELETLSPLRSSTVVRPLALLATTFRFENAKFLTRAGLGGHNKETPKTGKYHETVNIKRDDGQAWVFSCSIHFLVCLWLQLSENKKRPKPPKI